MKKDIFVFTLNQKKALEGPRIDMMELIEDIKDEGIQFPVVVRFQDILRDKVEELNETFAKVIEQYEYNNSYMGVYPIKVNQMREVVEEVLEAGKKFNFGLEAGSKGELLSVLAHNTNPEALTILNGYKDKDFLKLAMIGRKLGRKIIVVVEKFSELEDTIALAKEMNVEPIIGLRARLSIGGSGKWAGSSGDNAKFGLTTAEIINSVQYCKENGMQDAIKLIHFHIGSQVTNIQSIKNAITEATRFYTEVVKLGVPLEYLDVGGGLGVDYDGSSSTAFSSKNYNLESYVNDVVYTVKQICDLEEVDHPILVSESGRFVTAHHSCIITNVIGEVGNSNGSTFDEELVSPHVLVQNMQDILRDLDNYNLQEAYNDALFTRREVESAFRLGVLSLKEMARIDTYFWEISHEIQRRLEKLEAAPIDIQKLAYSNSAQYICNFSVFQSLPDCWAIDQLLPIVPLDRLDEEPTWNCTLVDITCDSDGKIDGFIKQGQKLPL